MADGSRFASSAEASAAAPLSTAPACGGVGTARDSPPRADGTGITPNMFPCPAAAGAVLSLGPVANPPQPLCPWPPTSVPTPPWVVAAVCLHGSINYTHLACPLSPLSWLLVLPPPPPPFTVELTRWLPSPVWGSAGWGLLSGSRLAYSLPFLLVHPSPPGGVCVCQWQLVCGPLGDSRYLAFSGPLGMTVHLTHSPMMVTNSHCHGNSFHVSSLHKSVRKAEGKIAILDGEATA